MESHVIYGVCGNFVVFINAFQHLHCRRNRAVDQVRHQHLNIAFFRNRELLVHDRNKIKKDLEVLFPLFLNFRVAVVRIVKAPVKHRAIGIGG